MSEACQPRIVIEDLPDLETLSPEEQAEIIGAGRKPFRPSLERLERREMFAGATAIFTAASGVLRVDGSTVSDQIAVHNTAHNITIDGAQISDGGTSLSSIADSRVKRIEIYGNGGLDNFEIADQIFASNSIDYPIQIFSNPGRDNVIANSSAVKVNVPADSPPGEADFLVSGRFAAVYEQLKAQNVKLGEPTSALGRSRLNQTYQLFSNGVMTSNYGTNFAIVNVTLTGGITKAISNVDAAGQKLVTTLATGTITDIWDTAGKETRSTVNKDLSKVVETFDPVVNGIYRLSTKEAFDATGTKLYSVDSQLSATDKSSTVATTTYSGTTWKTVIETWDALGTTHTRSTTDSLGSWEKLNRSPIGIHRESFDAVIGAQRFEDWSPQLYTGTITYTKYCTDLNSLCPSLGLDHFAGEEDKLTAITGPPSEENPLRGHFSVVYPNQSSFNCDWFPNGWYCYLPHRGWELTDAYGAQAFNMSVNGQLPKWVQDISERAALVVEKRLLVWVPI